MKIKKNQTYVNYHDLNELQQQYIDDCVLLENLKLPNDLFDGLYSAFAQSQKQK